MEVGFSEPLSMLCIASGSNVPADLLCWLSMNRQQTLSEGSGTLYNTPVCTDGSQNSVWPWIHCIFISLQFWPPKNQKLNMPVKSEARYTSASSTNRSTEWRAGKKGSVTASHLHFGFSFEIVLICFYKQHIYKILQNTWCISGVNPNA